MTVPTTADALRARLTDARNGGVFLAAPARQAEAAAAAIAAGLVTRQIDLGRCTDKSSLLQAFAGALDFPDHFGHNLDALADCLGDLEWLPAERGAVLLLKGCATPALACAETFLETMDVLVDAASEWRERDVPFWVLCDAPQGGIAAFDKPAKRPHSVLVLIHSPEGDILLIERAKHPGYWQSVTGSIEAGETPEQAAWREVEEETGIVAPADAFDRWHHTSRFEIYPIWRHRYPPGVSHNTEHTFSLCVPRDTPVRLAPDEHRDWRWQPWREALDTVFSWTNRDAIRMLTQRKRFARRS